MGLTVRYFLKAANGQAGPFTARQLRIAVRKGRISRSAEVRKEGRENYVSVERALRSARRAKKERERRAYEAFTAPGFVADYEDEVVGDIAIRWIEPPSMAPGGYRDAPTVERRPTLAVAIPLSFIGLANLLASLAVLTLAYVFYRDVAREEHDGSWVLVLVFVLASMLPAVFGVRRLRTSHIIVDDTGLTIQTRLLPRGRHFPPGEVRAVRASTRVVESGSDPDRSTSTYDVVELLAFDDRTIELFRAPSARAATRIAQSISRRLFADPSAVERASK